MRNLSVLRLQRCFAAGLQGGLVEVHATCPPGYACVAVGSSAPAATAPPSPNLASAFRLPLRTTTTVAEASAPSVLAPALPPCRRSARGTRWLGGRQLGRQACPAGADPA